jgi:hypothetical protein
MKAQGMSFAKDIILENQTFSKVNIKDLRSSDHNAYAIFFLETFVLGNFFCSLGVVFDGA